MVRYIIKSLSIYLLAVLLAFGAIVILYQLILNTLAVTALGQVESPSVAIGVSAIAVIAPVVAVMEALVSWLKLWRESRTRAELVRVIDAQSTTPGGMDIRALEKASRLPRRVLQDRVNELILLGRFGVRITPDNRREYFLLGGM